jgi:hypothetical protein
MNGVRRVRGRALFTQFSDGTQQLIICYSFLGGGYRFQLRLASGHKKLSRKGIIWDVFLARFVFHNKIITKQFMQHGLLL